MRSLIDIITAADAATRDLSLDALCRQASTAELLEQCRALDQFRRTSDNLYERVRALFFLYSIHRFHLPYREAMPGHGVIPFEGYTRLLRRRFDEAIDLFLAAQEAQGPNTPVSSALAAGYRSLGFQTLADQVRKSVRSVRGNQWMFRTGHPADYPLRIRPELLRRSGAEAPFPILHEATPVRMDLSHSGWSDIFFLGMDFPEGARVLNVSIDLSVSSENSRNEPKPPVEAYFRVIDRPVIRLTSIDLNASVEIRHIQDIFNFAADYLGLLKAALIAAGIVPPGMEGASQPLADLLLRLTGLPGHGIEVVSKVNDIPKGSRLAVSTNLLACLITACMRATRQIQALSGGLEESDRRLVAARAILGEWIGGSGGGWQDSGGVWPGIKLIHGVKATEGDPEFGISRGCLLPRHRLFSSNEVSPETRERLQQSLVLVHGGMAQDVGPILEMVTEKYLLRSEAEWTGRQEAMRLLDEIVGSIQSGDIQAVGSATDRNFAGPVQTIIPWAGNFYTQALINQVRQEYGPDFYGFWMLGGMAGGGMGFLFSPTVRPAAEQRLRVILRETKRNLERAVPFAMEPVIYDFAINERGTWSVLLEGDQALMPPAYYTLSVPAQLRSELRTLTPMERGELSRFSAACRTAPEFSGMVHQLFDHLVPRAETRQDGADGLDGLLAAYGFDRVQHERIQADMRSGRIGLAQNRLPVSSRIEDVAAGELFDSSTGDHSRYREIGAQALRDGKVAVLSLAGGIGTRWTKGAGVVKALNPFCRLGGKHRTFIEVHLAKSARAAHEYGTALPHIITTSYLTHDAIQAFLRGAGNYDYPGPLVLSPGRSIGLRLIPMERDLRFAWEESPQQLLDEQAQKVRESLHSTLIGWAKQMGEGNDYTDNLPAQCLHPVGHWYEVPNLFRNGVLHKLLAERPQLRYLMIHNIDTTGANVDPVLLGYHIEQNAGMTTEVIPRHLEDRGGGLAYVDGRTRLVEGLAFPDEEIESRLSYYNSATYWIDLEQLLEVFGLTRAELGDEEATTAAIRRIAASMPTYVTLKDTKKRWGKGQEDIFPVAQFEKLWGDMTALPGWSCRFAIVPRVRGQQLKEPAQLDGWLRDGSAAHVEKLCGWAG
ncbi:MAG: UTP--glucose-1-phosphate uridylyltransferase [Bryobacteraceae bacterium]